MSNALQHRRGTTVQHSTFTGAIGELTVDTTKKTVVVHDGVTPGGIPLAVESQSSGNKVMNSDFSINQRGYSSGGATSAGLYTLDRWKVTGTGGVTFSTVANKTTVTIPAGQTLQQVIEGVFLKSGAYVLSWEGTAQGRIGAGAYGASGAVTTTVTGGTNTTIEFNTGTVTSVKFERSPVATPYVAPEYDAELRRCMRYYAEALAVAGASYSIANSGVSAYGPVNFSVPMRAAPTITSSSVLTDTNVGSDGFLTTTAYGVAYLVVQGTAVGFYGRSRRIILTSEL